MQKFLTSIGFTIILSTFGSIEIYSQCPPESILNGEEVRDGFGRWSSSAGDVNNDGIDDIIVGAYLNDSGGLNAGRAYVYSGQDYSLLYTFTGETAGDFFGISVSGAGDVNYDGFDDLIIGAPFNSIGGVNAGKAYVYSGQNGSLLYTFIGNGVDSYLGIAVSSAGDVNNDGFDDLIFGDLPYLAEELGMAYVYSGQNGNLLYIISSEFSEEYFGRSVSGVGDVNKDGFDDVIVGAIHNSINGYLAGRAYVFSGENGTLLYTFTGEGAGDEFGYSVSGAGDVNNDGFADVIVGAWLNDAMGFNSGRAYVYSGKDGSNLHTFTGYAMGDVLGHSVSGAGDINKDGFDDLIVGAPGQDEFGHRTGQAYVYSGKSGFLLYTYTGMEAEDAFGVSVSGGGDFNNDGIADLIVGAYTRGINATDTGWVYVYYGKEWNCADANGDSLVTIDDVNYLTNYYFHCDEIPCPYLASDINCDGSVDISDIIYLQRYLDGGPAPCCLEQ